MDRLTSAFLFTGVFFLVFTFVNAYLFLREDLSAVSSSGFVEAFGDTLTPLIEACIRVMYLGVMGWIGSIMTLRGMQLLTQLKQEAKPEVSRNPNQRINQRLNQRLEKSSPLGNPISDGQREERR